MTSTPISAAADLEELSARVGADPAPPGVRPEVVESIMDRVGVRLSPEVFHFEVARIYEVLASGTAPDRLLGRSLRACHSYPVFQRALRHAGPAERVLIVGCGEGTPGLDYEYAREEWLKVWPDTASVETRAVSFFDLFDDAAWEPNAYDVVVSHSMVLYFYRIDVLFRRVRQTLRPDGRYVMGKEVNARFGRTAELMKESRKLASEMAAKRRRSALFDVRRHYRRLGRLLGEDEPVSLTAGVNAVLRRHLKTQGDITAHELSRLVEIHRPILPHSEQQIGLHGFDVDFLSGSYLAAFDMDWFESSGYLGYQRRADWSTAWRKRDEELSTRYSGAGIYFSACWRRRN